MSPLPVVALALTLVATAGCKIRIEVPPGGSVGTQSGSLQCNAGQTCDVDVDDLFFDETFAATPAAGFRFRHWETRQRGFCGGNIQTCRLFTAGFAGNDTLLGFLESDEVFFLTPVFESIEPGPLGTENGSVCFNPDIVQQEARLIARYRASVGGSMQTSVFDQRVQGTGSVNGNSGLRLVIEQELKGPQPSRAVVESIVAVNLANSQLRRFGQSAEGLPPQTFVQTVTYTPHLLTRWNLAAGQSYTQTFSSLVEDNQGFMDQSSTELRTTYLGTESIKIAAGTFQACRVLEEATVTHSTGGTSNYTQTLWYGVGNGVLLRTLAATSDTELTAGNINGVDL
ncbi:MAG: hypothetical protein RJQ10_00415 [Haliea sp.]|uniref:hypothetical protein n=1 Tax=Haliea sp. TaxID=1932666 RepID=UPI0032EF838E